MTIKFQEQNIWDAILGFLGKKRAVFIPKEAMGEKDGVFLAKRESFLSCLMRSKNKPLPKDWFYPEDL